MSNENVSTITLAEPIPNRLAEKLKSVSSDRLKELEQHDFACDYETLRMLWEAQCICSLIDDAMDGGEFERMKVQLAIQGVERILARAIKRTGWDGCGWENRS